MRCQSFGVRSLCSGFGFKGESMLAEIVSVESEFDVAYMWPTSLMRNTLFLGPYNMTIPRVL